MKDIKDFIKVADLYAQNSLTENKKIEEGLGDWLMDKLGFGMPEAEAVVKAAKDEAETLDIDPAVVDTTEIVGTTTTATTATTADTTGNKTAKEVWDEIKAKRDPLPQGAERVRLSNLMNQINVTSTTPEEAAKILAQSANRPSDAELDANTTASSSTTTATTVPPAAAGTDDGERVDPNRPGGNNNPFKNTTDRYAWINAGRPDIWPPEAEPVEKPGPQDELSATDTAKTGTDAPGPQDELDATDTAQTGTDAPATPASNGSLLGRKLDTTTPNIMKAYNDGGKQAMPTIRNMQTALSRLGFDPNGIDGKYGNGTFKAVQAFQKANGLAVDGQAGPDTMKSMKAILDKNFEKNKVTPSDTAKAANTPAPTTQNASKDHSMKKAIKESASMNVSMTADNASEVADLMKLLKNAGMDDAKPVSDIMSPPMSMEPSMPSDNMSDFVKMIDKGEKQDLPGETSCSSCGGTHEEDSCSEEYDAVIDEWDNSPEEEYKDANYMLNDLAGGINRPKKQFAKANDGDNAMAVENSIKEQLWAALNEKKADIKTTEGRGKVMAGRGRGKDKLMAGRGRGKKK